MLAGLQRKQDNMQHLVRIAENRESEAKGTITELMQQRADMLENGSGLDSSTVAQENKQMRLKIEEAQHQLEIIRCAGIASSLFTCRWSKFILRPPRPW